MNELSKFDKVMQAQIDADLIKARNDKKRKSAVSDPDALTDVIKNEEDMAKEERLAAENAVEMKKLYRR